MFTLFLSFFAFLCFSLLPQVQATPIIEPVGDNTGPNHEQGDNHEQPSTSQTNSGQSEEDQGSEDDEGQTEKPVPTVQTTLIPDSFSPWPCKTKYWCDDNDGEGLEICMEWQRTIVKCDRVQNLKKFKPEQRVSRAELHKAGKTLEEQLERIEVDKEENRCMFVCIYCGGEWADLVELKEHVVGVKHKKRYWRVQCTDRLVTDKITNKLKIGLSIFPRIFPWAVITYDGDEVLSPNDDRIPQEMKTKWSKHMVDHRNPACRPLPGVRAAFQPSSRPTQACALVPRK